MDSVKGQKEVDANAGAVAASLVPGFKVTRRGARPPIPGASSLWRPLSLAKLLDVCTLELTLMHSCVGGGTTRLNVVGAVACVRLPDDIHTAGLLHVVMDKHSRGPLATRSCRGRQCEKNILRRRFAGRFVPMPSPAAAISLQSRPRAPCSQTRLAARARRNPPSCASCTIHSDVTSVGIHTYGQYMGNSNGACASVHPPVLRCPIPVVEETQGKLFMPQDAVLYICM